MSLALMGFSAPHFESGAVSLEIATARRLMSLALMGFSALFAQGPDPHTVNRKPVAAPISPVLELRNPSTFSKVHISTPSKALLSSAILLDISP